MESVSSQATLPLDKSQETGFSISGKGYRVKLLSFLHGLFFNSLELGDQMIGPAAVYALIQPWIWLDLAKREREYPDFLQHRNTMPKEFWKGLGPRRHHYKMVRDWYEGGALILLYHRLGLPHWQRRIRVSGELPQAHPEWGKRPVIFTFLHTGPFALLVFWLRSQAVLASTLVGGLPFVVNNDHFRRIIHRGDSRHGVEGVPLVIQRFGGRLREVHRFLTPGHSLLVALDGGRRHDEVDRYHAGEFPIMLRRGAARLAVQTNAIVIPISIRRTALLRFEIHFGNPVPDELIKGKDFAAINQHLVAELWGDIQNHPGELNWTTLEALAPAFNASRASWP